jgi:glycosyltransferase involved in cell wall biosynthesis
MALRVLHIIPSLGPVHGGPSQAIVAMVQALRQAGVEAEIATTDDNGPGLLTVPLHQRIQYQGVPVWFFPRWSSSLGAVRGFIFSAAFSRWLWHNLKHYDVVHIHALFCYPATAAMTMARLQAIPYVVRPLGMLCHWSLQQSARRKQVYLKLIEASNLNHSRLLHFTSPQEQAETAELGLAPPGVVIPHGLSLPAPLPEAPLQLRQRLGIGESVPVILFLSRLHPKKGLELLIEALARLKTREFALVIAGEGAPDYQASLQQLVSDRGLGDRTHFLGFVEGELKNLVLQGSDLFALTSHSENFGIAVLEAMAAGLPTLVTPGVALSSVIQEQGLGYVPDQTLEAISQDLQLWLGQLPQARAMGQRARAYVAAHYSWQKVAETLITLYGQLGNGQAQLTNPEGLTWDQPSFRV